MKRIRDKVRAVIDRDDRPSLAEVVEQLNPIVRGWGNYFSRLNSSRHFWKVDGYVFYKLRRWLRRKHQRVGRAFWSTPPTFFVKAGLHVLHGTVAYGR
jgi:RNA-directed DNA polymerase